MCSRRCQRFLALLLVSGLCLAPLSTWAATYKVGAYYFGTFNGPSCVVCSGSNTDWWRGVRDYYNGSVDPPWQGEDFSYLKPALGFYDNSQAATLEKQILQARANGLQFFNFYWYWQSTLNSGAGGERYYHGLQAFLAAKNTEDLEFAVSITSHPWGNLNIPSSHSVKAIDLIIQKYLTRPHYLRTTDGRPVVFLLDSRGINNGSQTDVINFIATLQSRVSQQMGVSPFIVISSELHNLTIGDPNYLDVKGLTGVQGYSCLNYFGASLVAGSETQGSLVQYNNAIAGILGNFNNKPMIPCYMSDFNEKPRTRVGKAANTIRYLNDWNLTRFNTGLTNVRNYVNASNQGVVNNWVNLYAWNEWHEGGVNLEPSDRDGNRQLAQVASVFGLTTSGTATCKKLGDCTQNPTVPTGTLDAASCSTIAGWARDADTSVPLTIHLYKNGLYGQGGTFVGAYTADQLRVDLPFRDQKHGFVIPTPAAFKAGSAVTVYAYAINVNWNGQANGSNPVLNLSPKTITCAP